MAVLTASQIRGWASQAGLPPDTWQIAAAIALAESGGDTRAHNNKSRCDDSYGLWQINMVEGRSGCDQLGTARRRQFGIQRNDQLFDPATNARAMAVVSNRGQSWTAWSTYNDGTYRRFMDQAGKGQGTEGSTGSDIAEGVGKVLSGPVDVLEAIQQVPEKVVGLLGTALGAATEPFLEGLRRLAIIGLAVGLGVTLLGAGAWRSVKSDG